MKKISVLVCFCLVVLIGDCSKQEQTSQELEYTELTAIKEIQKQDAKEVFARSIKKLFETNGFYLKATLNNTISFRDKSFKGRIDQLSGRQQNPDMLYLELKWLDKTDSIYVNGSKTAYREYKKDKWLPYPKICWVIRGWPLSQIEIILPHIDEAIFIENVIINGMNYPGILVTINDKGLIELGDFNEVNKNSKNNCKVSAASYRIWFDPKSFLPNRVSYSLEETTELPQDPDNKPNNMISLTTVNAELFDYNKNISIGFPDEVKELFEKATSKDIMETQIQTINDIFDKIEKVMDKPETDPQKPQEKK